MEIAVVHHPRGIVEVSLTGRLNMVTSTRVRESIHEAIVANHPYIVVDMSGVSFLDSSGLGALVWSYKAAKEAGGDLALVQPSEQVELVLELTNMRSVLTIVPSLAEAFPS